MIIYFKSRAAMRASTFGFSFDNGPNSFKKRWCRVLDSRPSKPRVKTEVLQQVNPLTLKSKPVVVTFKKSRKGMAQYA